MKTSNSLSNNWFLLLSALVWLIGIVCWFELLPWSALAIAVAIVVLAALIIGALPGPLETHKRLAARYITLRCHLLGTLEPALKAAKGELASLENVEARTDLPDNVREIVNSRLSAARAEVELINWQILKTEAELDAIEEKQGKRRSALRQLKLEQARFEFAQVRMNACLSQ
jgi:hypothetical protein